MFIKWWYIIYHWRNLTQTSNSDITYIPNSLSFLVYEFSLRCTRTNIFLILVLNKNNWIDYIHYLCLIFHFFTGYFGSYFKYPLKPNCCISFWQFTGKSGGCLISFFFKVRHHLHVRQLTFKGHEGTCTVCK